MNTDDVAGCGGLSPLFKFLVLSRSLKSKNLKTRLNPPQVATNSDFEVKYDFSSMAETAKMA